MSKNIWLPGRPLTNSSMASLQTKSEHRRGFCQEGGQNSFVPRGLIHTDARINTGPHSVWPRQRDWDRKLGTMSDGFYLLWGSHYCWDLRQVAPDRYTSFHLENGNTRQKMLNIKKIKKFFLLNVPSSQDVIIHAAVTAKTFLQLRAGTVIWFLNNHIKGQIKWMWKFVTTEH